MNKRKVLRFLKCVMLYALMMGAIVTIGTLFICYRAGEISGAIVTPLVGLWSIELALGAYIKVSEGKEVEKKESPKVEEEEEITV